MPKPIVCSVRLDDLPEAMLAVLNDVVARPVGQPVRVRVGHRWIRADVVAVELSTLVVRSVTSTRHET